MGGLIFVSHNWLTWVSSPFGRFSRLGEILPLWGHRAKSSLFVKFQYDLFWGSPQERSNLLGFLPPGDFGGLYIVLDRFFKQGGGGVFKGLLEHKIMWGALEDYCRGTIRPLDSTIVETHFGGGLPKGFDERPLSKEYGV